MSTEKYLGMIVGYRKTLEQKFATAELKKEERAKQLANAFAQTDIEGIWSAASKFLIPHYDANRRLAGMEIELGSCGKLVQRRGMPCGLRIKNELYGGPYWEVVRKKDHKIVYRMQQTSPMWDDSRFNYSGDFRPDNTPYTAKDMRDSFLAFMAMVIPPHHLVNIEPVDIAEADATKTKRKIMVPA